MNRAHSYSFQTFSVLSTLSLLKSLRALMIDAAFGKKKERDARALFRLGGRHLLKPVSPGSWVAWQHPDSRQLNPIGGVMQLIILRVSCQRLYES